MSPQIAPPSTALDRLTAASLSTRTSCQTEQSKSVNMIVERPSEVSRVSKVTEGRSASRDRAHRTADLWRGVLAGLRTRSAERIERIRQTDVGLTTQASLPLRTVVPDDARRLVRYVGVEQKGRRDIPKR
jgi:hypothetical protein